MTAGPVDPPPAALMQGAPAPPERLVTLENWHEPPFNRWSYLHVRELVPTAAISRGSGPVRPLPREERDVEGVEFSVGEERWTVRRMLDETYTDGFAVLHEGRLIFERYGGLMTSSSPHLLQSVSKSLTATLAGILVGEGRLDPQAPVTEYVGELRGGSFEGATVQHLLDMRAGTRFAEDYDDPTCDAKRFEEVCGWAPRTTPGRPLAMYEYMASLANDGEHGGPFRYRSILTNVLGWVLERAGGLRFPELFSRELWSRLGAEHDAEITVDAHGASVQDGGMSVTLRDLARFGQLHLDVGVVGGTRLVPAEWIGRLLRPDAELVGLYGKEIAREGASTLEPGYHVAENCLSTPRTMYHDNWWVFDPLRGIYAGLGIFGQILLIHRPSRSVIAKLSTRPQARDEAMRAVELSGAVAICEALRTGTL